VSPWELIAVYIVVPLVAVMAWINRRYETDGAPAPEFEAWCRTERPVLFALRASPDHIEEVRAAMAQALGPRLELENHRGRYPWTLYLFVLALETDLTEGVVRGRLRACSLLRSIESRPEMGAAVDRLTTTLADKLEAVWVHAELREDDDDRSNRRERGWLATIEDGRASAFIRTQGLPAWARTASAVA
jgi:hypothetical protein